MGLVPRLPPPPPHQWLAEPLSMLRRANGFIENAFIEVDVTYFGSTADKP